MDTDGTSALADSVWRGSREQLDSIVIRAADWLTKWSEFPLATAMLYSRLALVTWGQRGAPAFGVVATVDNALTLRRAWNAFLQDTSNDELPLCLEAGLIEELGLVGTATAWHTDDVRVNIVTLPEGRMQGALYPGSRIVEHSGLRFRSHTEVRVAQALDEMGVMYFPLPVASRRRVHKEPDFLILHKGLVGVLEVDGPTHTPMTRAQEDARAAWFYQSGVTRVHHFSVAEIDADVKGVVRRFIQMLRGPTV